MKSHVSTFGVLGVPVDEFDLDQVISAIDQAVSDHKKILISTVNTNFLVNSHPAIGLPGGWTLCRHCPPRRSGLGKQGGFARLYDWLRPVRTCADRRLRGFSHLIKRVERHVAHDFAELPSGALARLKWLSTALLVLMSAPYAILQIARCSQINSARLGLQVFAYLCRIRMYRAWLMLKLLQNNSAHHRLSGWNRT